MSGGRHHCAIPNVRCRPVTLRRSSDEELHVYATFFKPFNAEFADAIISRPVARSFSRMNLFYSLLMGYKNVQASPHFIAIAIDAMISERRESTIKHKSPMATNVVLLVVVLLLFGVVVIRFAIY